jgi:hypothetical protein
MSSIWIFAAAYVLMLIVGGMVMGRILKRRGRLYPHCSAAASAPPAESDHRVNTAA